MITSTSLGENLLRQYPGKKKSKLNDLYFNPSKAKALRDKAMDKGTLGKVNRAWRDPKAKTTKVTRKDI